MKMVNSSETAIPPMTARARGAYASEPVPWATLESADGPDLRHISVTMALGKTMKPLYRQFGGALYSDLLTQGLHHFFSGAHLEAVGSVDTTESERLFDCSLDDRDENAMALQWLGRAFVLRRPAHAFTQSEVTLVRAIGRVLDARYRALFNPDIAANNFHLFRGLPEDKYVSAFLDPARYESLGSFTANPDRVTDAIEVLRTSALTTYENLRISTGALLLDGASQRSTVRPAADQALRYSSALTAVRSFSRFVDGIQTVALVDAQGRWVDIVDLDEWAPQTSAEPLPLCGPSAYAAHRRATLGSDDLCLTLTPTGEIKAFRHGVQVFAFLNGRWRLTDMQWKHERWLQSMAESELAERILQVGLDMAETRRGGLFVILDDPRSVNQLVAPEDQLDWDGQPSSHGSSDSKRSLYYLLRGKNLGALSPAMIRTLAAIDGAMVLGPNGAVMAFGAILRHHHASLAPEAQRPEGGRSLAALAASSFGKALKISEDGILSFYEGGRFVWEL